MFNPTPPIGSGTTPLNPAPGLKAENAFGRANTLVAASLERQATGMRINRGADDPAGLISSEQLNAQLAALEAETRASERADAIAATADAALSTVSGQLSEARALAVANANTGGMSEAEIEANQMQAQSIVQSVERQLSSASFNDVKLFDGGVRLSTRGETFDIAVTSAATLGLSDVNTSNPDELASVLSSAAERVNTLRGEIGSFQKNTLGAIQRNTRVEIENVSAANSIIRDTDFAAESAAFARASILGASSGTALRLTNDNTASMLRFVGR
ncbi:MAG: flagellin [Planctomycetota bacterium]